ncbi:nuclear transport factor 2 family protein [Paenibacillus pabuli]|uniref:nuclear transport factor 2 family protein n=1 Tax=Paenibacillus pabuli TaxID=1472 RepID=UPI001FFFC73F|nr:nuclear transport factor 2 family protein [Paenibacillus pabuli]UPK42667.1 nuclear transport factor 2 family protein [Paenibacillus pabuli]
MSIETMQAKLELRELVDSYAILTDTKKISEQMQLFTPDTRFSVYIGEHRVSETNGTEKLEEEFNEHVSVVKRYFTTNAQHVVELNGDTATGVVFSQMKMVRDNEDGGEVITDYSVQYHDVYVRLNGRWLIKERSSHYIIIESRLLQS